MADLDFDAAEKPMPSPRSSRTGRTSTSSAGSSSTPSGIAPCPSRAVLREAVADARRKADRLAAAAGRRLGTVRAIEEPAGDPFGEFEDAVVKVSADAPEVRPREQLVTASVKVAFELEG